MYISKSKKITDEDLNSKLQKEVKKVTIFGYSECEKDDELYSQAYKTGKLLAQKGYIVVNGAGPGVMRASSEGAKAGGGKTIGISFRPKDMTNFEGRDKQNPIDEEHIEPNYVERTLKLLDMGDVYIFFNGGTGTISEFGMAWGLARLYFGKHKRLILFGTWWHEILESFARNMKMRSEELKVYSIINTPEEAVACVENIFNNKH